MEVLGRCAAQDPYSTQEGQAQGLQKDEVSVHFHRASMAGIPHHLSRLPVPEQSLSPMGKKGPCPCVEKAGGRTGRTGRDWQRKER